MVRKQEGLFTIILIILLGFSIVAKPGSFRVIALSNDELFSDK